MKEIKVIGINGKKTILSMLNAAKKVCKNHDLSADQRTAVEALVFETTVEFLEDLAKEAKEAKEAERDEANETIDELFERFVKLMTEDDDDE